MMKNSKHPDISIIIPVRNGAGTLPVCLESVFRSKGVEKVPEVIVVDDASEDDSARVASRFPVELIRLEAPLGGGLTRNPGAALARAPILFFTDADVELEGDTLRLVLEAFRERPGVHALFGAYSKDCPQPGFFSRYKNLHHHFIHRTATRPADTFWTGCGAVRRDVFHALGGFRDVPYIYDVDLGYRLSEAGYRIEILPHIQVRHHKPYTFTGLLCSDFLERAVPWADLLWTHRRLIGGLNNRPSHVISVAAAYLTFLTALMPWSAAARTLAALAGLSAVGLLNRQWAAFCLREQGASFALRAMGMELFYFFYSGLGLAAGTVLCGLRIARGRVSPGRTP